MFPLFKSEVKTYHTLFHKERKKAFEGLAFLTSIANEISSEALSCSDELELTAKLKMLKRFSHIFEEFNHDVELAMCQFDKRMVDVGRGNLAAVDRNHPLVVAPSRIPKADLSIYKVGDRGKCAISYIKSIENELCFIVDLSRSRNTDFRDHVISHYDGLPEIGTVFAIMVENKYFRAIRTHSEATLISYQVTLIDIGETISMPLYRSEKFQLSAEASLLPPMAILCLVGRVDGVPANCLQRVLGTKRFHFEIVNICANMLQVELFTENENTVKQIETLVKTMSTTTMSQPSTPLLPRRNVWNNFPINFATSSMSQPSTPAISRRNICAYSPRDTNPFRSEQLATNMLDRSAPIANFGDTSPSYPMEPNNNHRSDWLTNKNHRNIVNRLHLETIDNNHASGMDNFNEMPDSNGMPTSACPKEDINVPCQTGAHPKGAQSSELNGGGNHENEKTCALKILTDHEMAVMPSAVVACDEIYAQLACFAEKFAEFQQKLNVNVAIRSVTKLPSVGETILARYDVDGLIYRAQVTQFIDRHSLLVLYVDYGNTERVTLDSVFEWDPFCDTLEFQAIKFTLANVNVKEGGERDVKDFLFQNILNKTMNATVVSTDANRTMVRLTDKDGFDIAEQLLARKLTIAK